MKLKLPILPLCAAALVAGLHSLQASSILSAATSGFSIDLDSDSNVPGNKGPGNLFDFTPLTDYVNFGRQNSGVILSGFQGQSPASSLAVTTASSFPQRDPASYIVLGTNDPVINSNNPNAVSNGWTYVSSGAMNLSTSRGATSVVSLGGSYSYSSYWVVFPTLRDTPTAGDVFQVDGVQLVSSDGGYLHAHNYDAIATSWQGGSPASNTIAAFDGNASTSYFNSGGANSGIVVMPSVGATVLQSFSLTTSPDHPENDPASYTLFGQTSAGVWQMIQSGNFLPDQVPLERSGSGAAVGVSNSTAYKSYGFVVNSLRDGSTATGLEFADLHFDTVVPEPSAALLATAAAALTLPIGRRRR